MLMAGEVVAPLAGFPYAVAGKIAQDFDMPLAGKVEMRSNPCFAGNRMNAERIWRNVTRKERLEKQKQRLSALRAYEDLLRGRGYQYIAGVDEAGRGPLAGPVVAAAVILPEDFDVLGVDDSKKLSEKKREQLFGMIQERAVAYGIGVVDEKVIDAINILQAAKLAMKQAVCEAERCLCARQAEGEAQRMEDLAADGMNERSVLASSNGLLRSVEADNQPPGACWQKDGANRSPDTCFHKIDYILFDAMKIEELDVPQESIIKGDAKILAIAAASILAKVTRDRMMVEYAKQYPGYAFEKNKGYGTKAHYAGLAAHGICPVHRRSFLKKWQAGQEGKS